MYVCCLQDAGNVYICIVVLIFCEIIRCGFGTRRSAVGREAAWFNDFLIDKMTVFSKFTNVVNAKWLLAMFVVLAAVSSCGFDDDETQPDTYPLELLGTWEGTDAEITVTDAEGVECGVRTESLENIRVVINPNGTFVTYECDETGKWREKDRSFWQYKDATLFVFDGGETIQNYNVTKVTSDYLVLKSVVDVPEPGDADAGDEAGDVAEELPAGGTVTTVSSFTRLMATE